MAVATKAKAARTVTREAPPPRMEEERMPTQDPMADRDPNALYTRDGRKIELGHIVNQNDDQFDLARMGVFAPPGWTYEWRVKTVKNWEWVEQQTNDYRRGWTPVPAERHDGLVMPKGYKGPIERGGQVLMERDARATALSRQVEKREADLKLNESKQMAGLMPQGSSITDFSHSAAQRATGVKAERTPVQNDTRYNYTLDE